MVTGIFYKLLALCSTFGHLGRLLLDFWMYSCQMFLVFCWSMWWTQKRSFRMNRSIHHMCLHSLEHDRQLRIFWYTSSQNGSLLSLTSALKQYCCLLWGWLSFQQLYVLVEWEVLCWGELLSRSWVVSGVCGGRVAGEAVQWELVSPVSPFVDLIAQRRSTW